MTMSQYSSTKAMSQEHGAMHQDITSCTRAFQSIPMLHWLHFSNKNSPGPELGINHVRLFYNVGMGSKRIFRLFVKANDTV